jgi:hypothetical protein
MPRRIVFELAAKLEFEAAIDWYNVKQPVYFYVEHDLIGIVPVFHSSRDPSEL